MSYRNCSRCKNYKNSFGICSDGYIFIEENPDSCLGAKYAICKAGKNEVMKKWWIKNGDIIPTEAEDLPCYEATDFDIALDNLLNLSSKLLNKN